MKTDWTIWARRCGVAVWLIVIGPMWLAGWGVLRISRRVNLIASLWCRALACFLPKGDLG